MEREEGEGESRRERDGEWYTATFQLYEAGIDKGYLSAIVRLSVTRWR